MLRPVYHALLEKYGFNESDYSSPWHMQSHPQPSIENKEAKILWDILWQLEKCPKDGANKPHISILDKKNKEWSLVEGMICTPGTIFNDLQIGVRGRLRVRVLSSEHAHFENSRPPNLKRVLSTENSYS